MKLIVGLGNPGDSYEQTRHNIGYLVADKLAKELGSGAARWAEDGKRKALTAAVGGVLLVKPITFMNASGEAVSSLAKYYKIQPADVIIIHDDLDLPLGKIRIRQQGGSAGHNGVQSVIDSLHTDNFVRVRLGIGRAREVTGGKQVEKVRRHQAVVNFVLSRFGRSEAGEMRKLIDHGAAAVKTLLTEGLDRAMNRFH